MISLAERERRWRRVREEMQADGYSALLVAGREGALGRGYIRYLADWHLWGGFGYLVFPLDDDPTLILSSHSQAHWARQVEWVSDVRGSLISPVSDAIRFLRERGSTERVGVVGMNRFMPYTDVVTLRQQMPGVDFTDATATLERVRRIKSPDEIVMIEESSRIVAAAMRHFGERLAPGRTEREVVSEAWQFCRERGVLDGIAHISSDDPPFVHPPGDRVISADDVIKFSMEMPGPSGYWIELGAVFSFSDPDDEYRRIFDTAARSLLRVGDALRPGVTGQELIDIIDATYRDDGWSNAERALFDAHGIGLDVFEPPTITPGGDLDVSLEAGMAINVHPGLANRDATTGQFRAIFLQDNFIVQEGGALPLSGWDHSWHVVS